MICGSRYKDKIYRNIWWDFYIEMLSAVFYEAEYCQGSHFIHFTRMDILDKLMNEWLKTLIK